MGLKPGTRLHAGKYSVERLLGQGGFGITYRGRDASLDRLVAIKEYFPNGCIRAGATVQPGGAVTISQFQQERRRFLDEAKVLAQFRHEAIVQVYASFEENNTAYMAMELVQGRPLIEMIEQRGSLPEAEALKYIVQVSQALREVHKAKMLHRDIKPDNIIVADSGRAVLIDFGTARQFAAGKTRRMTAMLTQGYAPLEQYGQQARFGTYTDIYALCATFYHVVTGQIPVQATDRASGVDLTPPYRVKAAVSRRVSDAIMWGLEMNATERPQTIDDFLGAIDPGIPDSKTRDHSKAGGSDSTGSTRFESRILQLLEEHKTTLLASMPDMSHDREIQTIKATVAKFSSFAVPVATICPVCDAELVRVTGQVTGACPVCNESQLKQRKLDPKRCPLCRRDAIVEFALEKPLVFCPVCRRSPLREERRKKFGLAIDLWWVCEGCHAEYDVLTSGKVKCVSFNADPFGVGAKYKGYVFDTDEWRDVAPLASLEVKCTDCRAAFYALTDSSLTLIATGSDPIGVGKTLHLKGKTYHRNQWSKLAYNLPKDAGNAYCPKCSAEFDFDKAHRTLSLRAYDNAAHAWVSTWYEKVVPIEHWYLMRSGKRSLSPGWLCSRCDIEFDDDAPNCKLVRTTDRRLKELVGGSMLPADWHRYVAGIPTSERKQQLCAEIDRLEALRSREIADHATAKERRRERIESELASLFKQQLLVDGLRLQPAEKRARIPDDETLRWETRALRLKQRSRQGMVQWSVENDGTLVVTNKRLLFVDVTKRWERTLDKLMMVEMQYLEMNKKRFPMIAAWFIGLQKPVGFVTPDSTQHTTHVSIGGHTCEIDLDVNDLFEMLREH